MPVNLLPLIIFLCLGWIVCLALLFRWQLWAGISFIGVSLASFILIGSNLNLEREIDEVMPYRLTGSGKEAFAEFITSEDESIAVEDEIILELLRAKPEKRAQVKMNVWYDFGRMRSYRIISVEGRRPSL